MNPIVYGGRIVMIRNQIGPDHIVAAATLSDHLFGLADAAVAGFFAIAATVAGVIVKDWLKNKEKDDTEVDDTRKTPRSRPRARRNGGGVRNRKHR